MSREPPTFRSQTHVQARVGYSVQPPTVIVEQMQTAMKHSGKSLKYDLKRHLNEIIIFTW